MTDERQEVTPEQMETITAILGLDAETFRRGKLGQYIFDRIEVQHDQLLEELIELAAVSTDMAVARKAANIAMNRMLPKFIDEAIAAGHGAERNIEQMEGSQNTF